MARLTITRARPTAPVVIRSGHPQAVIVSDGGTTLLLPYAPRGATLAGRGARFSTIDRPGRKPITVRDGDGLATGALEVTIAKADHQDPVEDVLAVLTALAESGERVTLANLSPGERGPWRIDTLSITGTLRQHGSNVFTRATVSLGLTEASDANPRLGPVSGGKDSGNGKKGGTHVVKKGDTLRSIAGKVYGDPGDWQIIAKANKITNATAPLKPGRKLTIPPPPKKKKK